MKDKTVNLVVNGRFITVGEATSVLDAARALGVEIPTICYHPNLTATGLCRVCVVEVEGSKALTPSCLRRVEEGMVVHTESERVRKVRRVLLEMLMSDADCSEAPDIQRYASRYGADPLRFPDGRPRRPPVDDNPFFITDHSKCILCRRCVQVCGEDVQYTFAISIADKGPQSRVSTSFDAPLPKSACVFCGNCVAACPTGALKGRIEWLMQMRWMT